MTQSILFSTNFTLYNLTNSSDEDEEESQTLPTLSELASNAIISSESVTKKALEITPAFFFPLYLKSALNSRRENCLNQVLKKWPNKLLHLASIVPPIFTSLKPLYSKIDLADNTRRSISYTTNLVHVFLELIKKREINKLTILDLTGYPSVEVIINYIIAHILLIHNETNQREIIEVYNKVVESLPESQKKIYNLLPIDSIEECMICLDITIETAESHLEVCRALSITNKPKSRIKFAIAQLNMCAMDVAKIVVLLELIDPKYFKGANIQYNNITNDCFYLIEPCFARFQNLVSLDISNNSMIVTNDNQANNLAPFFSTFKNLERLSLNHIKLSSQLKTLLSNLTKPLTMLSVKGCFLEKNDFQFLSSSHVTSKLKELGIGWNNLNENCLEFKKIIDHLATSLVVLEIEESDWHYNNLLDCFKYLINTTKLKYINASYNRCLTKKLFIDSIVYFFIIDKLEVVKASFPLDLEIDDDVLVDLPLRRKRANKEFSILMEQIIDHLKGITKRQNFQLVLEPWV